jgi:hypothetical protein
VGSLSCKVGNGRRLTRGRYHVIGCSIRLYLNARGEDVWLYYFDLRRSLDQFGMDMALIHPCADEMDDWEEYRRQECSHVRAGSAGKRRKAVVGGVDGTREDSDSGIRYGGCGETGGDWKSMGKAGIKDTDIGEETESE